MGKRLRNISGELQNIVVTRPSGQVYTKSAEANEYVLLTSDEWVWIGSTANPLIWDVTDWDENPAPPPVPVPPSYYTTDDLPEGFTNLYFTRNRAASGVLTSNTITDVSNVSTTGVEGAAARADHQHRGVRSIAKDGSVQLFADVVLRGGTGVSLNQTGQVIEFSSVGGGAGTTDDLPEGTTNLYFSNARAQAAAVQDQITDGVTNVAPSQNAVFDALALKLDSSQKGAANGVASLDSNGKVPTSQLPSVAGPASTDDLPEGSVNLYFTNARVAAAVVTDALVPNVTDHAPSERVVYNAIEAANAAIALKADASLIGNANGIASLDSNGKVPTSQLPSVAGPASTDDLPEGSTNLYFSNARAQAAAVADAIQQGVTNVAPSQGAVYDALAIKIDSSLIGNANGIASLDSNGRVPTSQLPSVAGPASTDDLPEGSTNLYFTNVRAVDALQGSLDLKADLVLVGNAGGIASLDGSGKVPLAQLPSGLVSNTDELPEGTTNLYFTSARAQSALAPNLATKVDTALIGNANGVASLDGSGKVPLAQIPSGVGPSNTDGLAEGSTNLYFTNARARAAAVADALADGVTTVAPSQNAVYDRFTTTDAAIALKANASLIGNANGIASLDGSGKLPLSQLPAGVNPSNTDALPEGTVNLYFTNARAQAAAVANAITNGVTTVAPSQDAVYDALALKLDASQRGAVNGVASLDGTGKVPTSQIPSGVGPANTDALAEGSTNLYFTNARARSAAVADSITDGITTVAPSQNAVFDRFTTTDSAIALKANASLIGNANGIASLDGSGKVPLSQLPSGIGPSTTDQLTEGSTNLYFSNVRAQAALATNLAAKVDTALVGNANGVASLDGSGKVPLSQIPSGGGGGDLVQTLTFLSGDVRVVAAGSSAELAGISASKVGTTFTLSVSTGAPRFIFASVYFSSVEIGSNTAVTLNIPETSGATVITSCVRPWVVRYNSTGIAPFTTITSASFATNTITQVMSVTSNQAFTFNLTW